MGLLAALGALPLVARATVMVEVPLEDMVRQSDVIVRGVVTRTGTQVVMRPDGLEPHTLAWVRVERALRGAPGPEVVVREIGGETQDLAMWIEGTPRYATGEEVLLFLREDPEHQGHYRTYGMAQGKFLVLRGTPGVPDVVRRDLEGLGFARWAEGRMTVSEAGGEPVMQLAELVDLIERIVALDGDGR